MTPTLIFLGGFAAIFGIVYVFLMTRHKERITLIERGVEASILVPKSRSSISPTLKFGMLFVGIGSGILVGIPLGNLLHEFYDTPKAIAPLAMVFLLGGLSLIVNFIIERKLKDE
ncbi:DUF6249 domain-containing protein [Telluribacter humicola]|uniref:DUF6249 domain-containing protein n=1 Tax=Telluribacter humicola TaxID=1720261 RepID=UPI001A956CE2|nr:DUF6249 domain-containing protein [Telluribacter humicola]